MRVLVCGSRGWSDWEAIRARVAMLPDDAIVIHGNADGADQMAGQAARMRGLHVAEVPALWDVYGKSAGHRRNAAMIRLLEPHRVIAFSLGTNGTEGCIAAAERERVVVEVFRRLGDTAA